MKKMSKKNEKILKIVHVSAMSVWFTSLIIMYVINLLLTNITSSDVFYFTHHINSIIDFDILTPTAIVTFLTGIIYGLFTDWEVKKNTWLKIKVAITVAIILLGTFWLGPTLRDMTESAKLNGIDLLLEPEYMSNLKTVTWFSLLNALLLLFAIAISTLKPGNSEK